MTPLFFKPTENYEAEEFKQVLPVNVNTCFDTLSPGLFEAEEKHIIPMLGDALTNSLKEYYDGEQHTDATKNRLIEFIQSATLRIAYFDYWDILSVSLTDSGVQNPNGDAAAYRYQSEAAKDTLGRQAFERLQALYELLVKLNLPSWKPTNVGFCNRKSKLIPSYRELFDTIEQECDYRLFARLRNQLSMSELTRLPFLIGTPMTNKLVAGEVADEVFVALARRVVCFHALAESVMILQGLLTDEGVTTRTVKAEGWRGGSNKATADKQTRIRLQITYREQSESAAKQLIEYLYSNKEQFPDYASTDQKFSRVPTNDVKSKIFRT